MRWLLVLFMLLPSALAAAPQSYRLVTEQSRVGFTWFFGSDDITGDMPVSRARILLDFDQPGNSDVFVAVSAANARAGAALASEAMKGQSVLWTDRYPEITFQSNSVRRDGEGGAVISGTLTLRGVARPQTFRARLFRPPGTQAGDRSQLTVRLDGRLHRSEFGADGFANMVGDEIVLDIRAFVVTGE